MFFATQARRAAISVARCRALSALSSLSSAAARERRAVVDEMLRVDQAGEAAAVQIYAGQMWVLRGSSPVHAELRRMREGEERHLRAVNALVAERRARPSLLLPVWRAAGFALGAATALLGRDAAMACTVAVETSISEHYNEQIRELLRRGVAAPAAPAAAAATVQGVSAASALASTASAAAAPGSAAPAAGAAAAHVGEDGGDAALLHMMKTHRDEELEHHDEALRLGAERAPFYSALTGAIRLGCAGAIEIAKRV
jgi:ubiquinone biosynthesis monooxygenase Coq7